MSGVKFRNEVATKVDVRGGGGDVTYHDTRVVYRNDEAITLDTGGWWTVTTKRRMNQASRSFGLGFSVFAKRGRWYVSPVTGWMWPDGGVDTVAFEFDSITIPRPVHAA